MDQPVAVVKAGELRAGMTILEITKFDSKFSCLDSETLQFLQGEFDGAMAVVLRDDAKKTLPMTDLKLFDEVTAITNLPGDSEFGQVVAGLGEKLESQGYFEFKVSGSGSVEIEPAPPPPPAAPPQKTRAPTKSSDSKHLARLDQARAILEKVGVAIENREEATSRIEEMMDQGRAGKFSARGAVESVEKMLGDGATSAMKALAGLKASDQTYAHCVDVAIIFQESYADMLVDTGKTPSSETAKTILVAGLL
ncbi:MAG: hypothetical protein V3S29_07885, partial [bacterium]